MKRARIIYNPTSGKELFKKHLPEVLAKLEQGGYETSCHATTCGGDATHAAKLAVERGFDIVISAGGDGTLNEVVTGLAGFENPPKLGIIPVGTTNDFARSRGIERDILKAVDVILEDNAIPMDIGKANDKYFINIAAAGNFTEISYEVPSKMKTALGEIAYFLKGIEKLPFIKPTDMEITYDDEVFQGEIMMFFLTNTKSVGGFEKLAPIASATDGLFDLIIVKKGNVRTIITLIHKLLRGQHLKHPLVHYQQVKKVTVQTREEEPMQLNLDGEYGGDVPVTFENLHHKIQVFVPKKR